MNMQITETAFAELTEIYRYIAKDNRIAARAVVVRVEQVISRIGEFPEIARPVDSSGVRVFPARPFPFLVFYTSKQGQVIIRNIRHARRRRPGEIMI